MKLAAVENLAPIRQPIYAASGEKIPRKGGSGITKLDLLVINKIDLADLVGADLGIMESDTYRIRAEPYAFSNLQNDIEGLEKISGFIAEEGILVAHSEKAAAG